MTGYSATYNDGKTAARHEVRVQPHETGLRIERPDGGLLDDWPYDAIELVDPPLATGEVRLRRQGAEARLTVTDPAILALGPGRLSQALNEMGRQNRWRRVLPLAAGIFVVAASLWLAFPLAVRLAAAAIPVSWEETLGDWALDETLDAISAGGRPDLCERAAGRTALDGLTAQLEAVSGTSYRFRVVVVDKKVINALALPGGTILLFHGLLDFADSPEEVAGVLAHEMSHVIERHGTERILRRLGLSLLIDAVLGGATGGAAGRLGEVLIALTYSREAETEADRTAIALLQAAGLRADGMAGFFRRLDERRGDMPGVFGLLSTHPGSAARARLAERAGTAGAPAMTPADWQALEGICGS